MGRLDGTERVRRLWEKGRSPAEIPATPGVSPPRARRLLHTAGAVTVVCCDDCGREITRGRRVLEGREDDLCLDCLASRPEVPFARRLRAYRLVAGLTQQELAERAGLNTTSIWQYEQGETAPRSSSLARLAAVLGEGLALYRPRPLPRGGREGSWWAASRRHHRR
jgi:DNA-binding XRE family transcriptional regulator